jgi:hypothetical protein
MPFKFSKAHGIHFRMLWLGIWKRSAKVPLASEALRTPKPILAALIKRFFKQANEKLKAVQNHLQNIDQPTAKRMKFVHQNAARSAVGSVKYHVAPAKHEAWYGEDPIRGNTSSFRLAGLGTMLAISISSSGGTNYHYDGNDHSMFHNNSGSSVLTHCRSLLFCCGCTWCRWYTQAPGDWLRDYYEARGCCCLSSQPATSHADC